MFQLLGAGPAADLDDGVEPDRQLQLQFRRDVRGSDRPGRRIRDQNRSMLHEQLQYRGVQRQHGAQSGEMYAGDRNVDTRGHRQRCDFVRAAEVNINEATDLVLPPPYCSGEVSRRDFRDGCERKS